MHLRPVLLLALAPSFGRIRASGIPQTAQPLFSRIPTEINNIIFSQEGVGLVEYAAILDTTGGASLVTLAVEERLLIHQAEEVKHLDIYNDDQRARLSHILEATQAVVGRRSALPTTIDPDTDADTLKELAAQFEITFLKYASLSSSPTWAKVCMAALLGKDTLIRLLPFLSEGFFNEHYHFMLQAAAVVGDFDTLHAVATHDKISSDDRQWYIKYDFLFSGSVEFVQKIATFIPSLIPKSSASLSESILLNHRSLYEYLYDETMKQPINQWNSKGRLTRAFQASAGRGWKDIFKKLYQNYPQFLNTDRCLREAATHGRINILRYLLFHVGLGIEARSSLYTAFGKAVGSGNIDAIKFLLDYDEEKNPKRSRLSFTQPNHIILEGAGKSGRWDGIEYLMEQKIKGDARFAEFKLAGDASWAVKEACINGNLKVLKQLLQKDSQGHFVFTFNAPEVLKDSLICACDYGHLPIVQELLKYSDVDPAYRDNKALFIACAKGHYLAVRELLRDGRVDAGAENGEPLIAACRYGYLLVVRELLQKDDSGNYLYNVDPAAKDNEALIVACENGNVLVVRELLKHERVAPGAQGGKPLIVACRKGHWLVVQELLQKDDSGKYIHNGIDLWADENETLI